MNRVLDKLQNKNTPINVPVKIEIYSTQNNCFYNVLDKVANDRGQIIYGWKLYNGAFIEEAERHAIWKSPEGELIDITPNEIHGDSILFLEDDKGWEYDGNYHDNVRVNITDNPLVDDYILLNETITKLWQTSIRKSKTEIALLEPVSKAIDFLTRDKLEREKYILSNKNADSICYCGTGNYYRDCHGYDLENAYNELLNRINTIVKNNSSPEID